MHDHGFTPEQLRGVELIFKQFDSDNSGSIDFVEFKVLARKMGIEMSDDALQASISKVASSQELDLDDFISWLGSVAADGSDPFSMLKAKIRSEGMRPLTNDQIEALRECFNTFDTDNSGSIDVQELGNVFSSFGQDLNDAEIQSMINEVDADGSGEIEFEEFLLLMMSNFGSQETAGDEVQSVLRKYDKGKTGKITRSEFELVMRELCGDALSEEEISEIASIASEAASPLGRGKPTPDGQVEYMRWESLWEAVTDTMAAM
ncbi:putative calmodulin-like protein 2 [Diplonema papillatum]|nr:putative calmodulin-like protein 2 [Diplonema papillatum]